MHRKPKRIGRISRKQKYNKLISDHHYPKCELIITPNKPDAKCDCREETNAVS